MANRRRRKTRKQNVILDTISNKNFIIISSVLLVVIIGCIIASIALHYREMRQIAEEQERIKSHVEDIYTSVEAELDEMNNYKTNSIIRISAVGDILLGSNLQKYGADETGLYSNIFSSISAYMSNADIAVGTYEHTITEENKVFANAVKESGINLVTLAHNHALDSGEEGLNSTNEYLESIGIETIGISADKAEDRVLIKEEKNAKIAFVTYTYDNGKTGVNIYNEELVKEDLEYAEENADFTIVLMHWGNVDTNTVSDTQKSQAQFLIDNGADTIIGAHPAALQTMEIIQNQDGENCLVAYSLGDYTSDFTSENSNLEIILNLELYYDVESETVSIYKVDYVPIYMNDYGSSYTINRYKLLDMKNEIANYGNSDLDKKTYEKLVSGIDKLYNIIGEY